MSEWQECKLSDIMNLKRGHDLPKRLRHDGNIPIFSSSGLSGFHNKSKADAIGVVTGRYGTIGKVFLSRVPFWPLNTTLYVEDFKGNDEVFVYYFLQKIDWEIFNDKSAVPGVNRNDVHKEDICIPPLPEQKAIAEVLSSLDDKIDLLHRQNKTLEQMAETLFRQWFVEEAGEDWEEYKVSDIANHIKENVKPGSNPLLTYRHYSLPAFDNGTNPVIEVGKEILSNKYVVPPQTILVSKLNPRVPRIWAIPDKVAENSICSTEFQVFQPKKELYYGFLCFLFKSDDAVGELEMAASGTSGSHQRVKPQDILNIIFSVSSLDKIEEYSQEVRPLIEKQQRNNDYFRTLESLRDTLLPKLMSGEIRVAL